MQRHWTPRQQETTIQSNRDLQWLAVVTIWIADVGKSDHDQELGSIEPRPCSQCFNSIPF